jgi:hypothetical protein
LGVAWLGLAWLGLAWLGLAWLGLAWLGLASLGLAWLGLAWLSTTHSVLYTQPLKMELTEGSETSANYNLTPVKYPKEYTQYAKHGESLKSRNSTICFFTICSYFQHVSFLLYL